mmetsp:Transcript_27175/g.44575  ORF Transcript_27175/g.44575 Transcript_27175/m.44575 type:complete len:106 (+) Transcript_27175:51-368(+)
MGINILHSNLGNGQGQAEAKLFLAKLGALSPYTLPEDFKFDVALIIAGPRTETKLHLFAEVTNFELVAGGFLVVILQGLHHARNAPLDSRSADSAIMEAAHGVHL